MRRWTFASIPESDEFAKQTGEIGTADLVSWDRGHKQPRDIWSISLNRRICRSNQEILKMRQKISRKVKKLIDIWNFGVLFHLSSSDTIHGFPIAASPCKIQISTFTMLQWANNRQ